MSSTKILQENDSLKGRCVLVVFLLRCPDDLWRKFLQDAGACSCPPPSLCTSGTTSLCPVAPHVRLYGRVCQISLRRDLLQVLKNRRVYSGTLTTISAHLGGPSYKYATRSVPTFPTRVKNQKPHAMIPFVPVDRPRRVRRRVSHVST